MASATDDPSIARKRACLTAAIEACCGDRALNYGKPEDNFQRIAMLWNTWLAIRADKRLGTMVEITSFDVATMNILLKIARLANTPSHADSWIDIAGYAACGADITGAAGAPMPTASKPSWVPCFQCTTVDHCSAIEGCAISIRQMRQTQNAS